MSVTVDTKRFNDAIKSRRQSKAKTAALLDTSVATINRIASGEPGLRLTTIADIANKLNLDVVVSFKPQGEGAKV